jgi:hypothetical protein
MLYTGRNGVYDWLVADHSLEDVLQACPELVVGRYVAVTSFDSGPLVLNSEDIAAGWKSRNDIAYSSQISDFSSIPRDHYDEWYVFDRPADLGALVPEDKNAFDVCPKEGQVSTFVNFGGFAFHGPNTDDLTDLFWRQLAWIQPESYVADGNCLNLASRNTSLFERIVLLLRSLPN